MFDLAKGRILIIDDDAALLGLLQTLLEEAGCAVETIHGAHGFTPQLMALSRPALVLLNPTLAGMGEKILKAVVRDFRKASRAPVVLFADLSAEALSDHALALGADGYVPIRTLLLDPASQLLGGAEAPPPPPPPAREPRPKVNELAADDILGLDLGPLEPTPQAFQRPVRPPPVQTGSARPSALATHLVNAIAEEVSDIEIVEGMEHFVAALDVMSDANLYTSGPGPVAGVFVPSAVPPDEGTRVDLTVRFPWGGELACEAVVEWTRSVSYLGRRNKGGFGARFDNLAPEARALCDRFARLRAPIQAPPPKRS